MDLQAQIGNANKRNSRGRFLNMNRRLSKHSSIALLSQNKSAVSQKAAGIGAGTTSEKSAKRKELQSDKSVNKSLTNSQLQRLKQNKNSGSSSLSNKMMKDEASYQDLFKQSSERDIPINHSIRRIANSAQPKKHAARKGAKKAKDGGRPTVQQKPKPHRRRLSRVTLGRNLTLSQTAGLKL